MKSATQAFLMAIMLLTLGACASMKKPAPFKDGVRVDQKSTSYPNREVSQKGEIIDHMELVSKLKDKPVTKSVAGDAQLYTYGAMGAAGVGGFLIGYNLFAENSSTGAILGGVGLIGVGFVLDYFGYKKFTQTIDTYNSSLPKKQAELRNEKYTPFIARYSWNF